MVQLPTSADCAGPYRTLQTVTRPRPALQLLGMLACSVRVKWSANRQQAWEMQDGHTELRSISPEEAAQIAARIGLPVPSE